MAILEQALEEHRPLAPEALLDRVRELGVSTARESTDDIRRDRNGR